MEIDLSAQLRLPGGLLGEPVFCPHFLDWRASKLLRRGLDVPVCIDPTTGELEDMVADALDEELRPGFAEFSELDELFVEPLRDVGDDGASRGGLRAGRHVGEGLQDRPPDARTALSPATRSWRRRTG